MKMNKFMLLVPITLISVLLLLVACDNRNFEPEPLPSFVIHSMTALPQTIYADNNITYSQIKVVVRNEDTSAAAGEQVNFYTDLGNIINTVTTDSMGIAETTFWDGGLQISDGVDAVSAMIEARVGQTSEIISVIIERTPEVNSLDLNINASEYPVNEVTTIQAQAFYADNLPVPDGTMITLETTKGNFQTDIEGTSQGNYLILSTLNGTVTTYWNTGTQSTPVAAPALVTARVSDQTAVDQISILPGDPRYMTLTPGLTEIEAGSNTSIEIEALVKDTYGNSVLAGIGVEFSFEEDGELGTLNPTLASTDEFGLCYTNYSPGNISGTALITAVADSANTTTAITIMSDDVNSIEFVTDNQVDLNVQGVGADESYEFEVNLRDMNGNLIDYEIPVYFMFTYGPEGVNMSNDEDQVVILPNETSSPDTLEIISNNGIAEVSINSGLVSGTVRLLAFCYDNDGDIISAEKINIVVHTGPPDSIILSHDSFNDGVDVGAGFWEIEVAALLSDLNGNPCDYGTAVFFSLPNDEDWASVSTDAAYCGNENAAGDSLDGIAYTTLKYLGSGTNNEITIEVQSGQFVYTQGINLPIQNAEVHVDLVPETLYWCQNDASDDDDKTVRINVYVADGQMNPISNQRVEFNVGLGTPSNSQGDNQGEYFGITDENGYIEKYWDFQMFQIPACQAPNWSSTLTTEIIAEILEAGGMDQATMTLIRYCDCSTNE